MIRTTRMLAVAIVAAGLCAPAAAVQEREHEAPIPHTIHTKLNLYRATNYNGDLTEVDSPTSRTHTDWNIRSIGVHPGDRWQICARPRFHEPCIVLDRSVPDATMIGVENQIGSARLVEDEPDHED